MTLRTAIDTLATRFVVDTDCDYTLADAASTTALMTAAQIVSRDTYFLFTSKADLTLVADTAEYDLLSSSCTKRVFHVQEVNINDSWLVELDWPDFIQQNPDYYKQASTSNPWCFTQIAPGSIRVANPPNATARDSTYKFVTGFYEHTVYTIGANENTELLGPTAFHDLIVDRAFLDNSRSYIAGSEGYERRSMIEANYNAKALMYREENLAKYRKRKRRSTAGNVRRVTSVGGRRY